MTAGSSRRHSAAAGLARGEGAIDALDPLHELLLDAGGTLVREIAATHCARGGESATTGPRGSPSFGDGFRATGSPTVAVNTWAKGIAKF